MTTSRGAREPYTTSFEATVERIEGRDVWLSSTYFYAESGGQPADRGRMGDYRVVDVQPDADGIVHTLADAPGFSEGNSVLCRIDRERRQYCMRAHTASHVLYGAARRCMDDLGYGGFGIDVRDRQTRARAEKDVEGDDSDGNGVGADIDGNRSRTRTGGSASGESGTDKVRVDFETSTEVDDAVLVELEARANRTVWASRDVSWETMSVSDARALDDIAFNEATEDGVFGAEERVRVVTIGGSTGGAGEPDGRPWDVAACGGTHVRNTQEIGPITVLDRSNPGEGLTRIEFAVGPAGIDRRTAEKRALLAAGRELGTNALSVPDDVARLRRELASVRDDLEDVRRALLDGHVADVPVLERADDSWLVADLTTLDAGGFEPNDVEDVARSAAEDRAGVVVLVGDDDGTFVVAGATADASTGANEVVADVTGEFGGGGGGSPTFAQGGGLDADPGSVVAWLRE
jgi:alanyl-tRNA synthetase